MRPRFLPMLLTGLVLAVSFLIAVQVTQSVRSGIFTPDPVSSSDEVATNPPESFAPVIIQSVSETGNVFYVSGNSEQDIVISVQNFGNSLRQIKSDANGNWSINFPVENDEPLKLDILQYVSGGQAVRSDETILRVPPPAVDEASEDQAPRALILVTSPGGPSSIFQSPFRGLPNANSISLASIDYDESGGVIFSGASSLDGRVRVYANNTMVGDRRVEANGRWYIIAADTLPRGSFDIRAELLTENGKVSEISVPFDRLTKNVVDTSKLIEAIYKPYGWQVRRALLGGGNQYTAIFAPENTAPIIQQ